MRPADPPRSAFCRVPKIDFELTSKDRLFERSFRLRQFEPAMIEHPYQLWLVGGLLSTTTDQA